MNEVRQSSGIQAGERKWARQIFLSDHPCALMLLFIVIIAVACVACILIRVYLYIVCTMTAAHMRS